MKLNKKQKIDLVEARLKLSMLQFHMSLPWIVRKLFSNQALDWYQKGKDDAYVDLKWANAKIQKIQRISK